MCPGRLEVCTSSSASVGPSCVVGFVLSTGPGVLIPKTLLGDSLLADDDVVPLTVSWIRPCSLKVSAKGCIGFLIFSGIYYHLIQLQLYLDT